MNTDELIAKRHAFSERTILDAHEALYRLPPESDDVQKLKAGFEMLLESLTSLAGKLPRDDGQIRFEDGPVITPKCSGWRAVSCDFGTYDAGPIQNPIREGLGFFWSGVGLRSSGHTPIINGRACGVFSSEAAFKQWTESAATAARGREQP